MKAFFFACFTKVQEAKKKTHTIEIQYFITYVLYAKPKGVQAGDGPFLLRSSGQQGWAEKAANNSADAAYTSDW